VLKVGIQIILEFDAYNYPNPFDPTKESTTIKYVLNEDVEDLSIKIYDIEGSLVYEYRNLDKTKGPHDIAFHGRVGNEEGATPLASGIYIVVVMADEEVRRFKMVISGR
jgi:flagellar hook assembly protein FlgD